jgi:predicted nucleic acid-binding protein
VVAFSVLTAWEIDRGLLHGGAKRSRDQFQSLLTKVLVVPVDGNVWGVASDVWAASAMAGRMPGDVDALIVASAKVWGYTLVTHDSGMRMCAAAQSPPVPTVDWANEST